MRQPGRIHAARVEKSPRLQRFLAALQSASLPLSTRTLQISADVCNAHTCVSELRESGYIINVERKGGCWFYELIGQEVQP